MVTDYWVQSNYELYDIGFAKTILSNHYSEEWNFIKLALWHFRLYESDIKRDGKNKTNIVKRLELPFKLNGWHEKSIYMEQHLIDKKSFTTLHVNKSESHKIDAVKSNIALEFEWNNKNAFFSRDLSELGRLHSAKVIDVGVIITRSYELSSLFVALGTYTGEKGGVKKVSSKYEGSTTHANSVKNLLENGTAGGCPVLVIGITKKRFEANGEIDTY
ncbi:BglII/BstYI family type II restriction endonuclease [Halobacillus sp. Cin3]|uniref:BglII/BstYI family type II restriction endonuclease n=1 Tax=Halobacillus sp. Cin3 TaxID=2928441 RepID=UPI00248EA733|nr:BglII/BstYI family type II restriction endonuclease [Halobacillus sp. Cin3]